MTHLLLPALLHRLQRNFGNPVEWALVKEHPWSTSQLRRVDQQQQQ
jgi:hypothetical protein